MISDVPRQKLCEIVGRFGNAVADNPRRCEGLLRDYCGSYRREIHALVNALQEKTAEELLSASDGVPKEVLIGRLVRRLEDFRGLDKELAHWAVVSWGIALGRFTEDIGGKRNAEAAQAEAEQAQRRLQEQQEAKRRQEEAKRLEEERKRLADEAQRDETRKKLDNKIEPIKSKLFWKISAGIGVGAALVLWFVFSPKPIEVQSVKFFGAGNGLKGQILAGTKPRTNYKADFRSNETQFIWYDLRLSAPASRDVIVDVKWLAPDGKTINQDMGIKAGSHGITFGWGYPQTSANWQIGRWVVEFSSGGKKITTGEFTISPAPFRPPSPFPSPNPIFPPRSPIGPQAQYDVPSLQANLVGGLRFFEGPKQAPAPPSRIYQARFDAISARFIRVEVNLRNAGQQPSQAFKLTTIWFREGREFWRGEFDYTTPAAQQNRAYSTYFGADAPGTWQRGNYTVQVFIGSQLIGTGTFVVQ